MNRKKYIIAFFDILVVFAAFMVNIWIKPASKRVYLPQYIEPFLIFLAIWIIISYISRKYNLPKRLSLMRSYYYVLLLNILISGVIASMMYFFGLFHYSRQIVFGTILLSTFLELFLTTFDYYIKKAKLTTEIYIDKKEIVHQPDLLLAERGEDVGAAIERKPAPEYIRNLIIEESSIKVFEYIERIIDLNTRDYNILSTTTRFNVQKLLDNEYTHIVNLRRINDIRFVNKFFEAVNAKMKSGGTFTCCVETKNLRKKRLYNKYPPIINHIYYFFDYIFKRLFPKFNITKRAYFFLTAGRNRVFSYPEVLGRLYASGFEALKETHINGNLYITVRKTRDPYFDTNPTYGPLIKLSRIGKHGKLLSVYKLRTMHPYAEYLQKYIYERSELKDGGKFNEDFRVTTTGRFFRKVWLDELPMIINLFKGDLKIVGVRPLSQHYYSLYSKELQEKRIQTKPGLIPPFYYDMPKTMQEIQESEMRYLLAYDKRPFLTDWRYFWGAIFNIIFKKARSQ
jgi:lipopolysaccharide/colanic/teichoic acid biosynthesis glycosyltransferase